ncbi:MAG TPA: right-handed parallel beta-helix repeat-containing protein [Tepidisphaeraceae bacterium]|nr:right-handed parallel beta-helix repeat-containing protein [Tepidisphaeraceae bacterium]
MSKRIVSRDLPAGVRSHSANTSNKQGRKWGRIVSAIEVLEVRRLLSTFVVTTNLDTPVPLPGSLREAIILADTNPGPDTITFNIPGPSTTIAPSIPLPDVTDSTTIDATTQPGYSGKPLVVIDGTATPPGPTLPPMPDVAPGADDGLRFTGGSSTVEGLAITGFQKLNAAGIRLLNSSVVSVTSNYIGLTPASTTPPSPAAGDFYGVVAASAGNSITSNLISGNVHEGAVVMGNGTLIQGNLIGTNSGGDGAFPNVGTGIQVQGASDTQIGGSSAAQRNVVSGNEGFGIEVRGAGSGNVIAGNYIGIGADGTSRLGNGGDGVIADAPASVTSDLVIGGTSAGDRNVISANSGDGININNVSGVSVLNNYVGVDASGGGTIDDGNLGNGITLDGATGDTTVGQAGAGNVIANNAGDGATLYASGTGNVLQANDIGTDAAGTTAMGNGNGVAVYGAGALIGGNAAAQGNVISANFENGVDLAAGTSNSSVQFNLIGLAADGSTALGNALDGIFIDGSNNQIGTPTTGNSIAYNGHNGITVGTSAADVAAIQNAIRGNNIYLNGGLGIDLGDDGVTMNDLGDADTGPNMLQNFPVLTKVTLSGNTATITGTLNSTPNTTFALDFFASQIWDTTHYGEGQKYLGSISVRTDASGNASFTATMPGVPSGFNYFAATATDSNGNTSEFCYDPEAATTPGQAPGVKKGLARLERRMKKSLFGEIEIRRRG